MTDLSELIEKLEKATGPDRTLDAEIMFDLYAKPVGKHESDGGPSGYLWPEDNPSWSFAIRFPGKDREWFEKVRDGKELLLIERDGALVLVNDLRVPPLTGSLDAAMKLAGGFYWIIGMGKTRPDEPMYAAELFEVGPRKVLIAEAEHDASAVLALVICYLKALSSSRKDGGNNG